MSVETIYSKVILCGEHSVLRGGLAIVAPFAGHELRYRFIKSKSFSLKLSDEVSPYEILFLGTIEKALNLLDKKREDLKLGLEVKSLVPLGKGLGGSAAISVLVSRLMWQSGFLKDKTVFSFAVEIENMFHGESSGVDIAGCLSNSVVSYKRGEEPKALNLDPYGESSAFYIKLYNTNEVGGTEDCIEKVLAIKSESKERFEHIDQKMNDASENLKKALLERDFEKAKVSLEEASQCFEDWGLYTKAMKDSAKKALDEGALAVKPTGSGCGGHLMALFKERPSDFKDVILI